MNTTISSLKFSVVSDCPPTMLSAAMLSFHDVLTSFELRNFLSCPIDSLGASFTRYDEGRLEARIRCFDRDTGRVTLITFQESFVSNQFPLYTSAEYQRTIIRKFIVGAVVHEIDECIFNANERTFDPHKGELLR